jgi:hypothetical protein
VQAGEPVETRVGGCAMSRRRFVSNCAAAFSAEEAANLKLKNLN